MRTSTDDSRVKLRWVLSAFSAESLLLVTSFVVIAVCMFMVAFFVPFDPTGLLVTLSFLEVLIGDVLSLPMAAFPNADFFVRDDESKLDEDMKRGRGCLELELDEHDNNEGTGALLMNAIAIVV